MKQSTSADWAIIATDRQQLLRKLPEQIIQHLLLIKGDYGGFPVDYLHHSLLTATTRHSISTTSPASVCALRQSCCKRSAKRKRFDPGWQEVMGSEYPDLQWTATGEYLTTQTFVQYRQTDGGVILQSIPLEVMKQTLTQPLTIIASDGSLANQKSGAGSGDI